MGRPRDVGVYRKENGVWEYRFITTVNGKQIQRKKCTDAQGNKLMTKTAAIAARTAAIQALHQEGGEWRKPGRYTVKTIFEEFRTKGRKDRAYQTIFSRQVRHRKASRRLLAYQLPPSMNG